MSFCLSRPLPAARVTSATAVAYLAFSLATSAPAQAQEKRRNAAAAPTLVFTPLGTLPGRLASTANAVSADGTVIVGNVATDVDSLTQAFRWEDGQMMALPEKDNPSPAPTNATRVSADGKVAVGFFEDSTNNGRGMACLWREGQRVPLGVLPGGIASQATAISADGKIVAGGSRSPRGVEGFLWQSGTMTGIGHLPGGFLSFPSDMTRNGKVVVGRCNYPAPNIPVIQNQAFRWTSAAGMVGLGFLAEGTQSYATGVSATGRVIVGDSTTSTNDIYLIRPFRWENGQMAALPIPPDMTDTCSATDITDDGMVIVGAGMGPRFVDDPRELDVPLLWREDLGVVNLNQLLPLYNVVGMEGWRILSIAAISDDGSTIIGLATKGGSHREAFRLRVNGPGGFRTLGYPYPAVQGRILLQGLAEAASPRAVSLELRPAGRAGQTYPFSHPVSAAPEDQSFTFPLHYAPVGSYNLAIQAPGYLRTVVPVEVRAIGGDAIPDVTLVAGDVNGDNRINLTDLVQLRANYGKTGTDLKGDLNGDGRVNLTDLVLLRANYGKQGAQ